MITVFRFRLLVWITVTVYGVIIQGSHLKRAIISESIPNQIYANITYEVSRESETYFRIAEPSVGQNSTVGFKLEGNKNLNIFGITERSGIVYIKDAGLLKNLTQPQVTLKINYGNEQSTEIVLELQHSPLKNCINKKHCSNVDKVTESVCQESCGVGAKSYCQWRAAPDISKYNQNYSTCTSDINTCPDGKCDDLEKMYPLICPQDCTTKVSGAGAPQNTKNKLGRSRAKGVCTCNEYQCVCSHPIIPNSTTLPSTMLSSTTLPSTTLPSTMLSSTTLPSTTLPSTTLPSTTLPSTILPNVILTNKHDACEYWCYNTVYMSITIVIVFVMVGIVIYCYRKKIFRTLDSYRTNENAKTLEELIHIHNQDEYQPNPDFDSKWEFPRNRLVLQQVIGEGEFGKVLKAQAKDIPGIKEPSDFFVTIRTGTPYRHLKKKKEEKEERKNAGFGQ